MLRIIGNYKIFVPVFLLAVFWLSWGTIRQKSAEYMPVRKVKVEGEFKNINQRNIRDKLMPLVNSGFMLADIKAIHRAAISLPWVKTAVVKRIWPDAFTIRLYEQQPVARWGENALLNTEGELFRPEMSEKFSSLAVIFGSEGQQELLLNEMKMLNKALQEQSLTLQKFIVNDRQSWRVVLVDGKEIKLGRNQPKKNFQRLLTALPVLGNEKVDAIASIDMRYPNGFSVTWKPGIKIDWTDEIKHRNSRRKT
jgi:cell division protein FtsQ